MVGFSGYVSCFVELPRIGSGFVVWCVSFLGVRELCVCCCVLFLWCWVGAEF